MFDRGIPSICYGLRGLVYFQIDLRGTQDRSALRIVRRRGGQPGDGAGADPGADEGPRRPHQDSRLLRRCAAAAATRSARSGRSCRSTRRKYRKELGAPKLFGETGYTTLERVVGAADVRGQRPAVRLHRRRRQDRAAGRRRWPRSACGWCRIRIPTRSRELFEAYVQKVAPKTVELKVTRMHGGKPWMTEFDNPFVQAAGRAIEQGFGQAPVFNREGGSIPVVSTFQEELGLPSRAVRRRPARRERARAGREARPRQLPQRRDRVGVSLRGDWEASLDRRGVRQGTSSTPPAAGAASLTWLPHLLRSSCARPRRRGQLQPASPDPAAQPRICVEAGRPAARGRASR